MSDATAGDRRVATRSPDALDRAFAAAYAVALAASLAVSWLTYAYVGPTVPAVREGNPVTATVIGTLGPGWMVWLRTAVVVVGYRSYAWVRARTCWSVLPVAFAWVGAGVQLLDLAVDLRVATLAGPPTLAAMLAASAVVAPAALAGIALRPPADPRP